MKYEGWVTMRRMIEASRNVPAVRLTQQLGPQKVADYARRLGLEGPIPPYLSITLGAAEATLLEMVSAYSAFANQGIRMQPYFITKVTDRDGNVLEEVLPEGRLRDSRRLRVHHHEPPARASCSAARRRQRAGWEVRSREKPGTTNDYTDAWFIGYDPTLVAGTWMGFDQKIPLGDRETGTRTALAPWIDFMGEVLQTNRSRTSRFRRTSCSSPWTARRAIPRRAKIPGSSWRRSFPGTEPTGYPGQ